MCFWKPNLCSLMFLHYFFDLVASLLFVLEHTFLLRVFSACGFKLSKVSATFGCPFGPFSVCFSGNTIKIGFSVFFPVHTKPRHPFLWSTSRLVGSFLVFITSFDQNQGRSWVANVCSHLAVVRVLFAARSLLFWEVSEKLSRHWSLQSYIAETEVDH